MSSIPITEGFVKYLKIVVLLISVLLSFFVGRFVGINNSKTNDAVMYSYNQGIVKEIDMQVSILELLRSKNYSKALEALENWTDLNLCQLQSGKINNNYILSSDDLLTLENLKKYRSVKSSHEVNKALKSCVNEVLSGH